MSGRGTLVGGPDWIGWREVRMGGSPPAWSPTVCRRLSSDKVWHHYDHAGDGRYEHAGPCQAIEGHRPHVEWCDERWYSDTGHDGRHECDRILPHDVHRCCCGEEKS